MNFEKSNFAFCGDFCYNIPMERCLGFPPVVAEDSRLLILGSAYAVLTGKTVLPRRMFIFHQLVWQLVFVLIPDIRQLLGAEVSTWDFVLSQGSGNAALCIWMAANAVWAGRQLKTEEVK